MEYYALTFNHKLPKFAEVVESGREKPRMREMVDELAAMKSSRCLPRCLCVFMLFSPYDESSHTARPGHGILNLRMHFQGVVFYSSRQMTPGVKENRPVGKTHFHVFFLEKWLWQVFYGTLSFQS